MIPRTLFLRNFMCYREVERPLDFSGLSIACLSGDNGAGKSTLLDALTWALWGESRLKSDDDLIALGETDMEVELVFALDGQDYQVIRKRSKGKRAGVTELYFHVRNGDGWKTLSGAGVRDTQETISRTLRMNYETFTNSAFLRQGHADEFTRKKPAERKGVLAEILGLSVYEELEAKAKERGRELDGNVRGIGGMIDAYEREANQREGRQALVTAAAAMTEQLEEELAATETQLQQATERVQQLEALRPQRELIAGQLERQRAEHAALEREIAARSRELADAATLVAHRDEIVAGAEQLRAAQADLERLDSLRAEYDTLAEQRRELAQAIQAEEARVRGDLRLAQAELKGLTDQAARRPAIESEVVQLTGRLGDFNRLNADLAAARTRRSQIQEQTQAVHQLQLERKEYQNRIDSRHDSLVATREEWKRRLKEIADRLRNAEQARSERERAATERSHLDREAERLNGVRASAATMTEQAGGLRETCRVIKTQGDEINRKLGMLSGDTQDCPLCGSPLGADGMAHVAAEYERQRQDLRRQYADSKRQADTLDAQLEHTRAEVQALERRVATLPEVAGRLARLDGELQAAEEQRRTQSDIQRDLSELELQLLKGDFEREARSELARIDAAIKGIGTTDALSRDDRRLNEQISRLEQQIGELADLRAQRDALQRELQAIDAAAPALADTTQHVEALRTTLEHEAYAAPQRAALAEHDAAIAGLGYSREGYDTVRAAVRTLVPWAEQERLLERADERLARERQAQARDEELLQRRAAELATSGEQLAQIDRQLRELPSAQHSRDNAATLSRNGRRALDVARRDLVEKQTLLQKAEDAAVELAACRLQQAEIQRRKGLFDELAVAFGKKGVQAMLIETAIPEIEQEANALLSHMTDNQLHLTFETQGATRKGDTTETLDIKIADALGTRDYDAYSGGESFRVDFAIRIALAKLLSRRAGARLETLVIDEGFGSQDARGRERLVEAITSVQRDFKQILVVTHIQELKDMFPAFIEITKTPRGSVWAFG